MPTTKNSINTFFASLTNEQIIEKLYYLKNKLPVKCTKHNYQLTTKLLGVDLKNITEQNLQQKLQLVADKIRIHLQIARPIKIITIANVEAGKFERIDNLNCIYINGDLKHQNVAQKLAILAHEMSHYYLIYHQKIYLDKEEENELLTEINAIYTGLGLLLLSGYAEVEKRLGKRILKYKVGYIQNDNVKFAIAKTAMIRKQNPVWILKNIDIEHIPYLTIVLLPLLKDYGIMKWSKVKLPWKLKRLFS